MATVSLPMDLGGLYWLERPLDDFAPGYYARVFSAVRLNRTETDYRLGDSPTVAVKVMREEHKHKKEIYEAFADEARLLTELSSSPHVLPLLGCGYADPRSGEKTLGIEHCENASSFKRRLDSKAREGWLPFIVVPTLPWSSSLLRVLRIPFDEPFGDSVEEQVHPVTRARFPLADCLDLAIQFAQLLKACHEQGIFYLDYKLEHVYWGEGRLTMIDWNASRTATGVDEDTRQWLVYRDLRGLFAQVLFPLFVGLRIDGQWVQNRRSNKAGVPEDLGLGIYPVPGSGLDFYGAGKYLDSDLQNLLNLGMEQKGKAFSTASDVLDEFTALRDLAKEGACWECLGETNQQLRDAQEVLRRSIQTVEGLLSDSQNGNTVLTRELARLYVGLLRFNKMRLLP